MDNIPVCVCVAHISLSISGRLDCFHVLVLVNNASMNMAIYYLLFYRLCLKDYRRED